MILFPPKQEKSDFNVIKTAQFFLCFQCRYWKRARNAECESERYNLYKNWARFLCFYKEQPLNLIR